jgi:hypothetical protein
VNSKKILLIMIMCLGSAALVAQSKKTKSFVDYKSFLLRNGMKRPYLTNDLDEFVFSIVQKTRKKPFTVYEYLGFSGAGYQDMDLYRQDFTRGVLEAVKNTTERYGSTAKTVFLLGGTVDGFGAGYEIIDDLIKQGRLLRKNVIVGGLVADAAVPYHLEGIEKGWGDVISPKQDVLFLMNTYKEPGQTESWELRSSPRGRSATVRVLTKLFSYRKAQSVSLEVFGGGAIAKKEAREFLERREAPEKMFLVLRPDYPPQKPEKLTGLPAATALASDPFIMSQPHIFVQPAGSTQAFPLSQYLAQQVENVEEIQ